MVFAEKPVETVPRPDYSESYATLTWHEQKGHFLNRVADRNEPFMEDGRKDLP
jgi:hypothetical protein